MAYLGITKELPERMSEKFHGFESCGEKILLQTLPLNPFLELNPLIPAVSKRSYVRKPAALTPGIKGLTENYFQEYI